MKKVVVMVGCALLVGAFVALENCKADDAKVAYVDLQQFMQKSKKAQQKLQKSKNDIEAKKNELEERFRHFKTMQEELSKQGPLMNEDVRKKKAEELQIEQIKLKGMEEEFNKLVQKEQMDFEAALQRDLTKVVDQLRAAKGLTVVLNRAIILSADNKLDLTDEVVRGYDASPTAAAPPAGAPPAGPAAAPKKAPVAPAKAPATK